MKKEKLISTIEEMVPEGHECFGWVFQREDVKSSAKAIHNIELSDEDADTVIQNVEEIADEGIGWDTIHAELEDLLRAKAE